MVCRNDIKAAFLLLGTSLFPVSTCGFLQMEPSRFPSSSIAMTTENEGEDEPIVEAVVRIDDGGSDLTNRFKYKVNALMGVFDPQNGSDDERQDGNILNAMLNFPVRYTFNIVGKTSGDGDIQEEYIEAVKKVIIDTAGDDLVCQITPRGKNFTKVKCEVEVQSATMINTIYDELETLERTVMRF